MTSSKPEVHLEAAKVGGSSFKIQKATNKLEENSVWTHCLCGGSRQGGRDARSFRQLHRRPCAAGFH